MSVDAIPDPLNPSVWIIPGTDTLIYNVHSARQCSGRPCVLHRPSNHHLRGWMLHYRDDKGQMERICPCHGVGHPDPDDLAYQLSIGREGAGIHGCPGCCGDQKVTSEAGDHNPGPPAR
jgi:hypothetical protein